MAGPWEKYQPAAADGPWKKYGKPTGEQIVQKLVEIGQPGQGPLAMAVSGAEAVPFVGPFLKGGIENMAALPAMARGVPYEDAKRNAELGIRAIQNGNPFESALGGIGGASAPFAAAGATQLGSRLLGMTGPMWQRALFGGGSGLIAAGGDSLARGDDPSEAVVKALFGAGLGATFPFAERGLSAVARALLRQGPSKVAQVLARGLGRDKIDPAGMQAQMDALGPDAVPADLGSNMQRQAAAIASLPGEGQQTVVEALTARNAARNARIQGDVNTTLGQAPIPSQVRQEIRDAQRALGPQYAAALKGAKAVDTSDLALDLDSIVVNERGEAQDVARRIRQMLNVVGTAELDPNPATLLNTRQAIDGMFDTNMDGNVKRILTEARKKVDALLTAAVPGIKDVDAQYRELAQQLDAFETGRGVLRAGEEPIHPYDLREQALNNSVGFFDRLSQGARTAIDQIIGQKANNLMALKDALKGDGSWNRQKLVELFGPEKAGALLDILERETRYQATFDQALRNSETAARLAAQKDLSPAEFGQQPQSITSLLLKAPQAAANAAARARSQAVNARVAEALMRRPSPEFVDELIAARALANRPGTLPPVVAALLTNRAF